MPIMVITNHRPLFFNEEKAMAVPLKIRKGIKKSKRLLSVMLNVNAARTKLKGSLS